jgi:ABC-type sugar transport system ATPase subunit
MRKRAQRVADMMGIGHLMDRKPAQLSGGQQQRVALGRALVKEPQLLLFDEPLSNLDARLRLSMRGEIKRLQMELGITSIYVTHDQVEAMTMADRVAVMKDGKLQGYAPPDELYEQPLTQFIAGFVGNPPMNFWTAEVIARNGGYYAVQSGLEVLVPPDRGAKAAGRGEVIVGVRPEDVDICDEGVPAEVSVVEPLGRDDLLEVNIGEATFRVLADPALNVKMGDRIQLSFNGDQIQFFDAETEESLLWA